LKDFSKVSTLLAINLNPLKVALQKNLVFDNHRS